MMLTHLIVASVITVTLVLVWAAVQALVRRHSPDMDAGDDVLACRMCRADGSCQCGLKLFHKETNKDEATHAT